MASLLRMFGDTKTADRLKREAAELAKKFDKAFWMPEQNFYSMALDKNKKQLEVISSNAGHLLWSRIISRDRARTVSERIMEGDLFSGW
jgi:glycogen debranching enzyme